MINTLKPDEKIGYIYSDVNSPIYKYLFEIYDNITKSFLWRKIMNN